MEIRTNPKRGVIDMAIAESTEKLVEVMAEVRDLLRELSVLVKEREEIRHESMDCNRR